jgi:hypothetical protein
VRKSAWALPMQSTLTGHNRHHWQARSAKHRQSLTCSMQLPSAADEQCVMSQHCDSHKPIQCFSCTHNLFAITVSTQVLQLRCELPTGQRWRCVRSKAAVGTKDKPEAATRAAVGRVDGSAAHHPAAVDMVHMVTAGQLLLWLQADQSCRRSRCSNPHKACTMGSPPLGNINSSTCVVYLILLTMYVWVCSMCVC